MFKKDINNIHDKSYKDLLSNKEVFITMLRTFIDAPWIYELNEECLSLMDKEFILSDYEELESDLVYKFDMEDKEVYFYVLMELQSKVDYSMPIRLFQYIYEVWRDILKNNSKEEIKNKGFKLPAVVLIVLYNGKDRWSAEMEFKKKINNSELFGENIINFKYMLLDVNRYQKKELIQHNNIGSAIFLLDQKVDIIEYIERVKEIALNFKGLTEKHKMILKNWLRNTLADEFKGKYEIENILTSKKEEIEIMTSNISRTIKEEFKNAEKKGMAKSLMSLLSVKFPDLNKEYEENIMKLNEEKIEEIIREIFNINTLSDLNKYFTN